MRENTELLSAHPAASKPSPYSAAHAFAAHPAGCWRQSAASYFAFSLSRMFGVVTSFYQRLQTMSLFLPILFCATYSTLPNCPHPLPAKTVLIRHLRGGDGLCLCRIYVYSSSEMNSALHRRMRFSTDRTKESGVLRSRATMLLSRSSGCCS